MDHHVFPKWVNVLRPGIGAALALAPVYLILLAGFGASPRALNVGYQPAQPVEYSHAMHAGELGIDCRYCHNTVETAAMAAVPPTRTCMNCHATIRKDSEKVTPVRESYATGLPIEWRRVHNLPDYAYFNHSAHVTRGIGCASCHGRIDKMDVVWQAERLSMSWCLECHRAPEAHLRPQDKIVAMDWAAQDQAVLGLALKEEYDINPSTDCSTCHR